MAVYKVPQDVEADDKLIGFLSMKQFIFVVIAALFTFAAFTVAKINLFMGVPFLPFIAVFAILGLYQRKDQPAEVYLLAMLGFYLKPHRRIWNQDGVLETVNITVPKKIDAHYTDGLSKTQVKSSLNRLSTLMDTRGWATKHAEYQTNVAVPSATQPSTDRLLEPVLVQTQPNDIHAADDMLDEANNPTAQNFDKIMEELAERARKEALDNMHKASTNAPSANSSASDSDEPLPTLHYNPTPTGMHQKILSPVHDQSYSQNAPPPPAQVPAAQSVSTNTSTMTPPTSDAILTFANKRDNNLSVETIAKEAERVLSLDSDETVSLH